MSKSNVYEHALLLLEFNGVTFTGMMADAPSPVTSLYVSLHIVDPDEGGDQSSFELAYPTYARVPVPRSALGWVVVGNAVFPVAAIVFPKQIGGSPSTAMFFGVGTQPTGVGVLLRSAPIVAPYILCDDQVTPQLTVATNFTED